jgi:hypothetical protein
VEGESREREEIARGFVNGADLIAAPEAAGKPAKKSSFGYAEEGLSDNFKDIDGDTGVLMSKAVGRMKEISLVARDERAFPLRNINKRNFYQIRGVWVDSEFTNKMPTINVKFGSDAYFRLLEMKPELKDILSLGDRLIVTVDGKAVFIADDVKDPVTPDQLEKSLKKA